MSPQTFYADAVLFEMDATLPHSIAAVDAAWGKVTKNVEQDPNFVIASTYGKRYVDHFAQLKPQLGDHKIEREDFDTPISTPGTLNSISLVVSSTAEIPDFTPGHSTPVSRASFLAADVRPPSFSASARPLNILGLAAHFTLRTRKTITPRIEDDEGVQSVLNATETNIRLRRVSLKLRVLIDCLLLYSLGFSHHRLWRVGVKPPPITITADDKRLMAGKPTSDPSSSLLSAWASKVSPCVVFEDSPNGLRAGIANGATVIAVCASHKRSEIKNYGAHYIIENMQK